MVPKRYTKNKSLGMWVNTQRTQYRFYCSNNNTTNNEEHNINTNTSRGIKNSAVITERIELLNAIGFEWDASSKCANQKDDAKWMAKYNGLIAYKEKVRDCMVPRAHPELGRWVDNQRSRYKLKKQGKPAKITAERIDLLNKIGFEWDASMKSANQKDEVRWMKRYAELLEYKKQHGDCLVPTKFPENPQLSSWVSKQRTHYSALKRGKPASISEERIQKLEVIGFMFPSVTMRKRRAYVQGSTRRCRPKLNGESNDAKANDFGAENVTVDGAAQEHTAPATVLVNEESSQTRGSIEQPFDNVGKIVSDGDDSSVEGSHGNRLNTLFQIASRLS